MAKETKIQSFLDTANKRLKMAIDADNENRLAAIEDLEFAHGEQWDAQEKTRRANAGRPALQINMLPKFIDQVVGDMLHNTPQIKVQAEDSRADYQVAQIRQGLISQIEYQSNAKGIYGYAARQMVTCGYGGWRVLTRYCDDNPFMQEIYLEGIRNPFLIYLDPSAKDQNYADAKWGFLLEKVPVDEFKDRYPGKSVPGDNFNSGVGIDQEAWYDGSTVTIAEYFCVETETKTMLLLEDGSVVSQECYDELTQEYQTASDNAIQQSLNPQEQALQQPQGVQMPPPAQQLANKTVPAILDKRETEENIIKHWIITGADIIEGGLEGNKFPGKLIPLVLLKGKELNICGKNHVYSLIRHAKDPQKMANYWNTSAAETIALAPKNPWIGTPKQFEGFEEDYASANVDNLPFLKYNVDPESTGPPQRVAPGQPPTAIFEQIRRAEENIKSVIGMFNADVGAPGSEQTGAAIRARQRPGDISTYEFSENWARAILYTGKIINGMIPSVYDTERDVRVRSEDGSETFVPVNTTVGDAFKRITSNPKPYLGMPPQVIKHLMNNEGETAELNDITSGKYGVVVTTGPSYATQREESASLLMQMVQAMPQQMSVAADLIAESMDFKDAAELAKRLRKPLVQSGVIDPRPDEQPPAPPEPAPEVLVQQSLVEVEKAKVQVEMTRVENEKVKLELEKLKTERDIVEANAKLQMHTQTTQVKDTAAVRKYELDTAKLRTEMIKIMKEFHADSSDDPLKIRKKRK